MTCNRKSPANGQWSGWRGRLAVTDRRVWFEANVLGLFGTEEELPIADIVEVRLKNTLGFTPNCLFIRRRDGRSYEFITIGRRQLMAIIADRLPGDGSGARF